MYDKKINLELHDSGVTKDGIQCNCMTISSIDSLFIYKKKHY